jgi:hypothetical protein
MAGHRASEQVEIKRYSVAAAHKRRQGARTADAGLAHLNEAAS